MKGKGVKDLFGTTARLQLTTHTVKRSQNTQRAIDQKNKIEINGQQEYLNLLKSQSPRRALFIFGHNRRKLAFSEVLRICNFFFFVCVCV